MKVTPKLDHAGGVELRAADRRSAGPPASADTGSVHTASRFFSYLLLAAIVVHALLVVGATTYTFRSVAEIREVNSRLDALSEFESRIYKKISAQDIAVQTLINETNARLSTIRSDVEAATVASVESSRKLDQLLNWMESRQGFVEFERTDTAPKPEVAETAISEPNGTALPNPPAGYRRLKGADGSVIYEKIR